MDPAWLERCAILQIQGTVTCIDYSMHYVILHIGKGGSGPPPPPKSAPANQLQKRWYAMRNSRPNQLQKTLIRWKTAGQINSSVLFDTIRLRASPWILIRIIGTLKVFMMRIDVHAGIMDVQFTNASTCIDGHIHSSPPFIHRWSYLVWGP